MKKAVKVIGDVLFWVVIVGVLLFSAAFALNKSPEKNLFGYRAYNILSGSMEPELKKGDLVVVKVTPPEDIQVGDVVTYYPGGDPATTVTHRVIHTMMDGNQIILQTQGDAVEQPDPTFPGKDVVGVVSFHIPVIGGVVLWMQTHVVMTVVIAALVLLLCYLLGKLLQKEENDAHDKNPLEREKE